MFMPSGRFAIHLAFQLLLSPGDRILMSPLEDDTVFFGALAAGLRPVMAPVSTHDAAHALETDIDGCPIGSFGAVSAFSLSKHFPGRGGVLAFDREISRRDIARLRDRLMLARPIGKRTLGRLRDLGRDREERIAGVLRLRALDAVAPAAREGDPLPLLRVPLLIENRDAVTLELRRRGINVYFVYAPPLDEYSGPEFCEPSALPEAARWWATHILPVDPHDAERVLDLVGKNQIRLTAAAPPPV